MHGRVATTEYHERQNVERRTVVVVFSATAGTVVATVRTVRSTVLQLAQKKFCHHVF